MNEIEEMKGVIWITGYSSSGKTTVGRKVEYMLRNKGLRTLFLDGDDLRSIFAGHWGYEREQRIELAKIYFRLCSHLAAQGFTIVISAVAMYDEVREWLVENVPASIEVYLDVPEEERRRRDEKTKGVYANNKFGKDLYDEATNADLVIQNFAGVRPDDAAGRICDFFLTEGAQRSSDRGKTEHWDSYYQTDAAPMAASTFAEYTMQDLGGAPKSLLEVGCGNGRDAVSFSAAGHTVCAIDASRAAIESCSAAHDGSGVEFIAGKVDDTFDIGDRTFDVIYSRFCLHAMTPAEESEFLVRSVSLLNGEGRLYIECRSINDRMAYKGEVLSPTERIHGHYRRFIIKDELVANLESLGFSVRTVVESDGLAVYGDDDPVVIRIVAEKPIA